MTAGITSTNREVGSETAERFVRAHPWLVDVGRVGWAAKGVVYVLTGLLAFTIAAQPYSDAGTAADGQADPTGAIATIAEQPFGTVLLWLMAVGLLVYAAWRFVTVILPADVGGHALARRLGYAVSGITYVALALTAISLARRAGSGRTDGQDSQVTSATADVMAWTGGRWLVGTAGIVVIGVGVYFFVKAVRASFEQELEHRAVGPVSWKTVSTMGRIGWIGRALMMGLIGVFVTRAAIRFDPDEARGIDDSLRRVAESTLGMTLVYAVAIGLVLYGAFCLISLPIRKLVATDEDTVAS